ncbi:pyridoxal phosphate-dependent decarboxylase family protein [Maribacter sp. 2307ULW6-5]|uniref:pyridoxal phosphate-dependent decarboxylase family protein n=1 Tax=Maribacter sp. 2307ULW6-5 TaxID=3386275 RepID=UPI0039BD4B2B
MKKSLLAQVYDPESFREQGHALIDQLADHLLENLGEKGGRAIAYRHPDTELAFWRSFMEDGKKEQLFPEILEGATKLHHPQCIGHQVAPPAPITALTAMIGGLLNNGMAIYEMGMSPTAMERVVTEVLCEKIGYQGHPGGFLTSGGTLANLTALLTARRVMLPEDVWNLGHGRPLGIMVSEEAHYCVDRAAKIMGLGEKGIIKVPTQANYAMDNALLEEQYRTATEAGIHVFAIIGSAPCTATGAFDDLEGIATFAAQKKLWFHVDGAHGGATIFSEKYRPLLKGIEKADSVIMDGHKMMMMPTITTALLYKNGDHAKLTFRQKADYLLSQSDRGDWYNAGKKTFECTKTMMSVHWYTLLKYYGTDAFNAYVTQLYDQGAAFAEMIGAHPKLELAVRPMCNIVCFRYVDQTLSGKAQNKQNETLRQALLENGEFYVVQTKLRGVHYLRITVMNPFTTKDHMAKLLHKIENMALAL